MCHVSASKAFSVAMLIHNERGFSLYVSTSWACFLCRSVVLHIWCWCSLGPPAQPLAVVWRLQSSALSLPLTLSRALMECSSSSITLRTVSTLSVLLQGPLPLTSASSCLSPRKSSDQQKSFLGGGWALFTLLKCPSLVVSTLFSSRSCSKVFLPFPLRC